MDRSLRGATSSVNGLEQCTSHLVQLHYCKPRNLSKLQITQAPQNGEMIGDCSLMDNSKGYMSMKKSKSIGPDMMLLYDLKGSR